MRKDTQFYIYFATFIAFFAIGYTLYNVGV
jgi:hypothetical protein